MKNETDNAHYCCRRVPMNPPWLGRNHKFCFKELSQIDGKWHCPLHGFNVNDEQYGHGYMLWKSNPEEVLELNQAPIKLASEDK